MLDSLKLENIRTKGVKTIAACPACRAAGADEKGDHLIIYQDGRYGCVAHEGDNAHRKEIFALVGIPDKDEPPTAKPQREIVATYDYTDDEGNLIHQTVRYEPKDFRQRRPDGHNSWDWKLGDTKPVLYNLPAIAKANMDEPVWVVEGEKDVDALTKMGIVATTCPMGAKKWKPHYNDYLKGRRVILCPDNDETGIEHMEAVEEALKGVALSASLTRLSSVWKDCPEKGDISDFIDAGSCLMELLNNAGEPGVRVLRDTDTQEDRIWELLNAGQYDEAVPPPESLPIASLGGVGVIWRGNVHALVAGSKVGKTRFMASLARAAVTGESSLGWSGSSASGQVIYLDFEQDAEDFYNAMHVQAGVTKDDVHAYHLAGVSANDAQQCVDGVVERHPDADLLLLDGFADLCNNVNDPEESNALVAHLMGVANKYNVAVLGVLHLNPGSEAKSRGHLGSQLERKSKTVLQINCDDDGVRTVYTKLARKKPIRQKDGVRFHWCGVAGNFIELNETKAQIKEREHKDELRETLIEISEKSCIENYTHKELIKELKDHTGQSESSVKKKIREMKDYELLTHDEKLYTFNKEA